VSKLKEWQEEGFTGRVNKKGGVMKKSLTLMEVILASIVIGVCIAALLPVTTFYFKTKQRFLALSPSEETAATLETAFQSLMRTVNISDEAVVELPDSDTLIWKTQSGTLKRLKFNSQEGALYYDDEYNPAEEKASWSGEVILKDVERVSFSTDEQGRVLIEIAKSYPLRGGKRTLTMRTAVRPYLVRSLKAGKSEYWVDISPVVEGKLIQLLRKGEHLYAVVEADLIAIHNKRKWQDAQGEIFYVLLPLSMKEILSPYLGKRVVFNGDILPEEKGWYMRMNPSYGGGVILGEENIRKFHKRVEEGKEVWYQQATRYLQGCFKAASKKGVDLNNWKELWSWMRYYYHSYLASLKAKGIK